MMRLVDMGLAACVVAPRGWLVGILCGAVLARLHIASTLGLPAGAGGMVGSWLVQVGMPLLNWVGLTLLALVGLFIGAQTAIGFSWLSSPKHRRWIRQTFRPADAFPRLLARPFDRTPRTARATRELSAHREVALETHQRKRAVKKAPEIQVPPPTAARRPPAKPRQQPLFEINSSAELPDFSLLDDAEEPHSAEFSGESLEGMSRLLELKLKDFGIEAEVVSVLPGPVVTRFEIQPAPGLKVSRISGLVKDLARSLAVISVRIVEVIPANRSLASRFPTNDAASCA